MAGSSREVMRIAVVEADRSPIVRCAPSASFVSQLIAERDRLPAQRQRRRGTVEDAIGAYGEGERRDARRLPQGFFRSAEA